MMLQLLRNQPGPSQMLPALSRFETGIKKVHHVFCLLPLFFSFFFPYRALCNVLSFLCFLMRTE